ncbi:hypothetical protein LAZ67_3006047 [Cordylochernes scorpioides]|uniref:Uncharacterized protein n=1 Tax=Cordylochernes scorpioides TaxID=51811 RepID=A0ABY6KAU8_9ARAC|nr:hypothetical protein LAZ67_3006047 [Cordylochernes scorpioides]
MVELLKDPEPTLIEITLLISGLWRTWAVDFLDGTEDVISCEVMMISQAIKCWRLRHQPHRFLQSLNDVRIHVWRHRGECRLPACIRYRHTGPLPEVMVWSAIGYILVTSCSHSQHFEQSSLHFWCIMARSSTLY